MRVSQTFWPRLNLAIACVTGDAVASCHLFCPKKQSNKPVQGETCPQGSSSLSGEWLVHWTLN